MKPNLNVPLLAPKRGSAIPSAQVLIFKPELTHSVWIDVLHRKRSRKRLEAMLRNGVRSGEYVGYRLLAIEVQYTGISWPNESSSAPEDAASLNTAN